MKKRTPRPRCASVALMSALSRDLCAGALFDWVLHRREAQLLADLPEYSGRIVTRFGLAGGAIVTCGKLGFMHPAPRDLEAAAFVAARRGREGRSTVLLGPARMGALWFEENVWAWADIYFLRPSLVFDGQRSAARGEHLVAVYPPALPPDGAGAHTMARIFLYDWKTGEKQPLDRAFIMSPAYRRALDGPLERISK